VVMHLRSQWAKGGSRGHTWWKPSAGRTLRPLQRAGGWSHLRGFSGVYLRHSTHASAPQPDVLVAVSPAVDGALNETPFLAQIGIQLREGPSDGIALAFVMQAVAFILFLVATRAWVHAVVRFELGAELFDIYRLDIATDGVLHLDAVSGVLERDPLHPVVVLPNNEGRGRGDRAGSCGGIRTRRGIRRVAMHTWTGRGVRRALRRSHGGRRSLHGRRRWLRVHHRRLRVARWVLLLMGHDGGMLMLVLVLVLVLMLMRHQHPGRGRDGRVV